MNTIIKNIQIITPKAIIKQHYLCIQDGKIEAILPDITPYPHADTIIDGLNQYLSPGFIDIHNHGNSGCDTMDATHQALTTMANYHLNHGVTSFLTATMTNPIDRIKQALSNVATYIKKQSKETSSVLGIYLEGPYFNAIKKGAQPLDAIKDPNIHEIESLIKVSQNTIKVVALAPELPLASETITYLLQHDIKVAIGHSNASYDEAKHAIDLGATISTHLYNGMKAFTHREPSIIGACLTEDTLYTELICDNIHLHKAAIDIAKRCKGNDKIILISDAMRAAGLPDGTYDLGGQQVIAKDHVARLKNGALAGSTLNLNLAVKHMIKHFNTPLIDAVNMATINPAKAIGVDTTLGSIEVGKQADLLLFDGDIQISHVFKYGKMIK